MSKDVLLLTVALLLAAVGFSFAQCYDFPLAPGPTVQVSPTLSKDTLNVVTRTAGAMSLEQFLASTNVTDVGWLANNATDLADIVSGTVPTIVAPVNDLINPNKSMYIYGDMHPIWLRVSLGPVRSTQVRPSCYNWVRRCDTQCAEIYFVTHFEADVRVKPDFWRERIEHISWVDP